MRRIVLIAGGLAILVALGGVLRPEGARAVDEPTAARDTLTVAGSGAVRAVPDRASISAGVETRGATAQAALAANAAAMADVIAALRAAGGKDVTTQNVSLAPQTTAEGKPNGFVAMNVATAELPLAQAGKAIDAAVAAGANTVYGPTFTFSDDEALYLKALDAAVANAKTHAERLAAATGRSLGPVISVTEGSAGPIALAEKSAAAGDASTPIVSGEQEVVAMVSVTYELR
jgi:hypothetical protein